MRKVLTAVWDYIIAIASKPVVLESSRSGLTSLNFLGGNYKQKNPPTKSDSLTKLPEFVVRTTKNASFFDVAPYGLSFAVQYP